MERVTEEFLGSVMSRVSYLESLIWLPFHPLLSVLAYSPFVIRNAGEESTHWGLGH